MENGIDEMHLFDAKLLKEIDWELRKAEFKDGICPQTPGFNLTLRPLKIGDYEKGVMTILRQLTVVGNVSQEQFIERFLKMQKCNGTYYTIVLEDIQKSQIIGSATLVVEQKLIHSCGQRGRIEDVVVSDKYRGQQLGKLLVQTLTLLGEHVGCYKLSLECADDKQRFYESFGYKKDGQQFMVQRFKE